MKKTFFLIILLSSAIIKAQNFTVNGTVKDSETGENLTGANVLLQKVGSEQVYGVVTNENGFFTIPKVEAGTYILKVSFIGYGIRQQNIQVDENLDLGVIKLKPDKTLLEEVEVREVQERVKQMGDTTQYNASAFKVNPDASAQDLLSKMPGVVVQDGKIQAQGEDVKKVLVDGKEFFSNDPTQALQALPAEIIDKIQVYDQKSEQAQFTGFDDGNSEKTINILTKTGKSNGQFGKVYGGYGSDNRYSGGFNLNYFNGDQRLSLLGNFNNINKQNFSIEDILGAIGNSSGRRGGFRSGGGSNIGDFYIGQQNGIITTNATGLNYIDEWGEKIKVSGSYFFNQTKNASQTLLNRKYFSGTLSDQIYSETDSSESNNRNHRFNMRIEYEIDDKNSLIFRPSGSFQNYETFNQLSGATFNSDQLLNSTQSLTNSDQSGYNFSGDLLFRHKFDKDRRTLSLNIRSNFDHKDALSTTSSDNFFSENDSLYLQKQQSDLNSYGKTYSGSLRYTEPMGEKAMILIDYSPSIKYSNSDKRTYGYDSIPGDYTILKDNLSSVFSSSYQTQEFRVGYMFREKDNHFMFRLGYQNALLASDQQYPLEYDLNRSFNNFLPMAMFRRKLSDTSNIRIFYRSNSNAPSISQLQDVINNTNVLQLKGGNPDLDQEIRHFVVGNYALSSPQKGRSFFVFLLGEYKQDHIGNSTFTATSDTSINGYALAPGSQFTRPVNLDGYFNGRSTITYGFPLSFLQSNLHLHIGGSYTNAPGLINNVKNFTRTVNFNGGWVLGSNISEKVDFTISYNSGYNFVNNTLAAAVDNNYFNHIASAKFNWLFGKGFVFNTNLTNTYYMGLLEGVDQNFFLWNAYLGYKFLKNNAGELKLSVFDILGQNTSVSRTITETYLEDVETTVLQRYFMLSFTYTLRNFNGGSDQSMDEGFKGRYERIGPSPGGNGPHPGPPPGED